MTVEEEFEDWFQSMLLSFATEGNPPNHPLGNCLMRDVLRKSKKALKKSFIEVVGPLYEEDQGSLNES